MAYVPAGAGSGFWLSVTLVDNQGDSSTLEYELRSADYATATTDTATILAALNGVTNSNVSGYILSYRAVDDAFVIPVGSADNSIRARVVSKLTAGNKKATFEIPAPVDEIFTASSGDAANEVNITDILITPYANLFKTTGVAFISDGESLDQMLVGRRVARVKRFRS